MQRATSPSDRPQRGAALLIVITMVALVTLLVVEFQRESRFEVTSAANSVASLEAHGVVRSGYAAAVALMKDDKTNTTEDDRTELWYVGEDPEAAHTLPVGEAMVSVRIEDQWGKFPVNSLWDATSGTMMVKHRDAYIALLDALEFANLDSVDLADALLDWIDEDATGPFEINPDFEVPNAPIEHLDEIARIEGYNTLDKAELDRLLGQLDSRYEDNATQYKINLNTASAEVLYGVHSGMVAVEDAVTLHETLGSTPATSSTLNTHVPAAKRLMALSADSERFRILIEADVRGIRRKADCIIRRSSTNKGIALVDWTEQ